MNQEILYKFFSNNATIEQETQVLDWLELSPANRSEMLRERKLYDQIILLADEKVLYAKRQRTMTASWTTAIMRYAAVILLSAAVSIYYMSSIKEELLSATNSISVPAGQHVDVVLSDGTKVCVNSLSTLEYPAAFVGSDRQVKLTGEAFFEVAHDESKPFVVKTFTCDVEVLGTKFNILANSGNNEFVTSLVEGKVRLTDNVNPNMSVVLSPNQQASYEGNRLVVREISRHESFQWRDGLIAFSDAPFMELINKFERYYGVKIEVQRKDIPQNLLTGKIRIAEGIDHALWVLQQSCRFKFVRNELTNNIYIR